jgi:hypothetical protein
MSKLPRIVAILAALPLLPLLALPVTASAQDRTDSEVPATSSAAQASPDEVSTAGIGNGVYAKFNYLSLFQCPDYQCNQGFVANGLPLPADDVAAICQLPTKSPRGNNWVLLLNHQNNHVGFADIGDVVAQNGSFSPPAC